MWPPRGESFQLVVPVLYAPHAGPSSPARAARSGIEEELVIRDGAPSGPAKRDRVDPRALRRSVAELAGRRGLCPGRAAGTPFALGEEQRILARERSRGSTCAGAEACGRVADVRVLWRMRLLLRSSHGGGAALRAAPARPHRTTAMEAPVTSTRTPAAPAAHDHGAAIDRLLRLRAALTGMAAELANLKREHAHVRRELVQLRRENLRLHDENTHLRDGSAHAGAVPTEHR
jgi:hypothetical protein